MKKISLFIFTVIGLVGCSSYQHAQNVKMISFSDDVSKGQSVGMIEGQDCTWHVMGYKLGGEPTISKAFSNTQHQADGVASAGLKDAKNGNNLRYVNNVSTERGGFDAKIFGKDCLMVKAQGYK